MKEEKEQAVFKKHCRLAMAIIIASQTQEEALKTSKRRLVITLRWMLSVTSLSTI